MTFMNQNEMTQPATWDDLKNLFPRQQRDLVVRVVSQLYNVEPRDILSKTRRQPETRARQHAMYLLRTKGKLGLSQIGRMFDRDLNSESEFS